MLSLQLLQGRNETEGAKGPDQMKPFDPRRHLVGPQLITGRVCWPTLLPFAGSPLDDTTAAGATRDILHLNLLQMKPNS